MRRLPSFLLALIALSANVVMATIPLVAQAQTENTTCCRCWPTGESNKSCLTIDAQKLTGGQRMNNPCTRLPSVVGESLKGWTCEADSLSATKCQAAPQGVCQKGAPVDAFAAGKASEAVSSPTGDNAKTPEPGVIPKLNTPIPGFSFTGSEVTKNTSSLLARYIAAVYGYAISIAAVAATVMFTWGAFLYLLGSALPSISKGKTIMTEAVIGMILVLSANFILRTINPDTLSLSALYITGIDPSLIGNYQTFAPMDSASVPSGTTGVPNISKQAIAEGIMEGVKLVPGIDACTILAICDHETGLRPIWNGIQSGNPMERAIAFGPCQIIAKHMNARNPITERARALFPDFPQGSSLQVGQWLMNNPKGSGYVAAMMFKSALSMAKQNELTAVAAYGAGSGSMLKWQAANKCTPKAGQRISSGTSSLRNEACVPHSVAIPTVGDDPKGCPEDRYECGNAKADKTAQIVGTCSNGRKCYAMITDDFVSYVMRVYPRIKSQYRCGS